MGMRMREFSERIPKPMVPIGHRPILWHLMKYYAYYGHRDFILCLGYKGDVIKRFFLEYDECISNDFVLSNGGKDLKLLGSDISDWNITFVDTGLHANIGMRLRAVQQYLQNDNMFLANYSDGLSDLPLTKFISKFQESGRIACFIGVVPKASFHVVYHDAGGLVEHIQPIQDSSTRVNGGFFAFRQEIFDYIDEGDELVEAPFRRLVDKRQLLVYPYDGFWGCMDTYKEKQELDDIFDRGKAPWEVWRKGSL
jgi:glucose-1-phosphate cytidylyltransferase